MAKRKETTIHDVAEMAGCSIGTVSRMLNGYDVTSTIKKRIEKAIERLNYIPMSESKTTPGRGGDVLILVHDTLSDRSSWTQMVLFNTMRVLGDYGYRSRIEFRSASDVKISPHLRSADACIVWGKFDDQLYETIKVKCRNIPIVSYTFDVPYENAIAISSNKELSMSRLVSHLQAARHQKIGFITHDTNYKEGKRYKGFEKTMNDFGCEINDSWIITDTASETTHPGFESTQKILKGDHPTAIIYGSDQLAMGGMEAIKRAGLSIPEDVSVVSFDDLPESSTTFPPLTTMRLDMISLATLMVESLEKLILGRMHEKKIFIERQLIQRESVALRK